jgi:hypothetical protein
MHSGCTSVISSMVLMHHGAVKALGLDIRTLVALVFFATQQTRSATLHTRSVFSVGLLWLGPLVQTCTAFVETVLDGRVVHSAASAIGQQRKRKYIHTTSGIRTSDTNFLTVRDYTRPGTRDTHNDKSLKLFSKLCMEVLRRKKYMRKIFIYAHTTSSLRPKCHPSIYPSIHSFSPLVAESRRFVRF